MSPPSRAGTLPFLPLPLPPSSRSRRCNARYRFIRTSAAVTNAAVASVNALASSFFSAPLPPCCSSSQYPSSRSVSVVAGAAAAVSVSDPFLFNYPLSVLSDHSSSASISSVSSFVSRVSASDSGLAASPVAAVPSRLLDQIVSSARAFCRRLSYSGLCGAGTCLSASLIPSSMLSSFSFPPRSVIPSSCTSLSSSSRFLSSSPSSPASSVPSSSAYSSSPPFSCSSFGSSTSPVPPATASSGVPAFSRPREYVHGGPAPSAADLDEVLKHVRTFLGADDGTGGGTGPNARSPTFDTTSASMGMPSYLPASMPTAVPLVASRVALPETAGAVNLVEVLPPHLRAFYASPAPLLLSTAQVQARREQRHRDHERAYGRTLPSAQPPRARVFASHDEYVALVRRMVTAGMLDFTTTPAVVNGLFGVPKGDDGSIRLIVDARPANDLFTGPAPVQLPTPDLMANLSVSSSSLGAQNKGSGGSGGGSDSVTRVPLYVAKVDLSNYYHQLKLPSSLQPFFALPPLSAATISADVSARFGENTMVYPMCTTLPMGWSHSVLLAQAVHEHIATTAAGLHPHDRITNNNDFRIDRTRHQLYIDDCILFGTDPHDVFQQQQRYIMAMQRIGLPISPKKVTLPSADGVECLGLLVHGRDHTVGLAPERMVNLCLDTHAVLAAGQCTGAQIARLLGRWTWACLAARPALSVLSSAYRFVEVAKRRRFQLWPSVARELAALVGLAPLLVTDLGAGWCDKLIATDASEVGAGVTVAAVPADAAEAIAHAGNNDQRLHVLAELDPSFTTIISSRWWTSEHINVLESRSLVLAVRWLLSLRRPQPMRVCMLSDSSVVVGAVNKGRSSSHPLLRRLRHLAALLLASGHRLAVRWIPTDLNPADAPSRGFGRWPTIGPEWSRGKAAEGRGGRRRI